jgi:hypothetical protein
MLAEELQLSGTMRVLQLFEEATPEQTREHSYREEEARLARHPPLGIGSETATGYDAVHMRMMSQRRAPSVQHQSRADARLFVQIERLMDINHLAAITDDVVNAARRMLVIGTAN